MTLEFIAAAQDYKQRWEAIKDFYRWRKYPEEKPEKPGYYLIEDSDDEGGYTIHLWDDRDDICTEVWNFYFDRWTNLPPLEDK